MRIHYETFPDEFDEDVAIHDWKKRCANLYSHTENWRTTHYLTEGRSIDAFLQPIARWESIRIAEVHSDGTRVKVGSRFSEWIDMNSELLARRGTHCPRSTQASIRAKCPFPNGKCKAIKVAIALIQNDERRSSSSTSSSWSRGMMIFEELASFRQLPRHQCISLAQQLESGKIVAMAGNPGVESRRCNDAKAAFFMEAAYARADDDDEDDDEVRIGAMYATIPSFSSHLFDKSDLISFPPSGSVTSQRN